MLYRHLKDLFYGHTYRNTDGVILVCPVSGAAIRSFLTGNLKLSLEKAETFKFLHVEPSIVFPFSSLIYLGFKCQEILCKNNSGKLPFVSAAAIVFFAHHCVGEA